jgi:2'-5' RNA ligase
MDTEDEKRRCFVALNLPKELVEEIIRVQNLIKRNNFFIGKFTEPENIHLTLKFLGEINQRKIEEVRKRLLKIKLDKFDIELGEVGIFSKKIPRILWVKLIGKGVFELQKEVDSRLKNLFTEEERFMSHITIARIKHVPNKKDFFNYLKNTFPRKFKMKAKDFSLLSSELTPEGPIYSELRKYVLERKDQEYRRIYKSIK